MSKFSGSTRVQARNMATGPIQTDSDAPRIANADGLPAYERDVKSELFVLAVANMVDEQTFYEGASERDQRFRQLCAGVSAVDPGWIARFIPYLRNTMQMRSASVVMAAEFANARLRLGQQSSLPDGVTVRKVIDSACVRADEPAELLGYWLQQFGRSIPSAVKRGLADATLRLYNERNALKYDGNSRSIRMGDVIELTHPKPKTEWQNSLFKLLIDQRHGRGYMANRHPGLDMIAARTQLETYSIETRRALVNGIGSHYDGGGRVDDTVFARAGMTWESLAGWLQGPMDAAAWEAVIPSMGYMALLRNLRNFNKAGLAPAVKRNIADRIADPTAVAKSRQFPFRFLSAYKAIEGDLEYQLACERALNASLSNVPALPGRTLILLDWSGSMWTPAGGSMSDMSRAEVGTLFGVALGMQAEHADVIGFGSRGHHRGIALPPGASVLPLVRQATSLGDTDTQNAVDTHFSPGFHDRIVLLTDEQFNGGGGWGWSGSDPLANVPANVPCYTWNLAGYRAAQSESGPNRHTFAGLTDKAFVTLPLLEAGTSAGWPF